MKGSLWSKLICTVTVITVFICPIAVHGMTYTVTTGTDVLPIPGTLRWAIQSANANAGTDTIDFNIGAGGPWLINLFAPLDTITEAVCIDGYTEVGAQPNTQPQGNPTDAVLMIEIRGAMGWDGFHIHANDVVIRGLCINCFWNGICICSGSQNCRVIGCYIGTDVYGNEEPPCTTRTGVSIQYYSSHNWVGGTSWADRNVISGWDFGQVDVVGLGSDSNVVIGNYIGTEKNGTSRVQGFDNNGNGVSIYEDDYGSPKYNRVGGSNDYERNVISGNGWHGIEIAGPGRLYNVVENNYIGVNVNQAPLGNGMNGVILMDCTKNNIIGPDNIIAYNVEDGIEVIHGFCDPMDDTDYNTLTQNSIYENGELGIDLGGDEVTPNDLGDPDTGQNEQLNFPVITSATYSGPAQTTVTGTIDIDTDHTQATVEVFVAALDPSGYGEGKTYLGFATPVKGTGSWNIVVGGVSPGDYLTATTTDVDSNTSEFGECVLVVGETPDTLWYFKACYDSNYAPAGMPDFDQKQDNWVNPNSGNWSFCGPTALANCLWWIDSRFEHWLARVNGGPIGSPGDGYDRFPLVRDYTDNLAQAYIPPNPPPGTNNDDHAADNVDNPLTIWQPAGAPPGPYSPFAPGLQPVPQYPQWGELIERLAYCCDCDGSQSGGIWEGTYVTDMEKCIDSLLIAEDLDTLLYEHTIHADCDYEFDRFIREQIHKSQDVILLIGYWYVDGEFWWREGGHYVTVAGVGVDQWGGTILAISDPFYDNAEPPPQGTGGPGCVHNSIYQGHPTPHDSSLHNDAGNASHDWYSMVPPEPFHPSYHFMLEGYPPGYKKKFLDNFYGQNVPRGLEKYQDVRRREYKEKQLYTTLIEYAVVISPYPDYSDIDPYPEAHHSDWTEEWLGESVSPDMTPRFWDQDTYDDGVTFFTPYDSVGAEESLQVTISVRDRYACEAHDGRYDADHLLYLHGWIDWNVDGDFDDADENIFSGVDFDPSTWSSNSYTYTHIFIVPDNALAGTTCTRFRLDYNQNLNDPAGQAFCGEVEDYCNELIIVSVPGEQGALNVPRTFALEQNYPNPFNLRTVIRYQIPEDCRVTLEIYNLLGQKVRTLISADQKANYYTAYWDGKNKESKEVTSGIYFYTLRAGKFTQTRRMVILK